MTDAKAIGANMADREPNFLGLFNREPNVLALKSGETLFQKGDPARQIAVPSECAGRSNVNVGEITKSEAVGRE
jgi:hypothetical protein